MTTNTPRPRDIKLDVLASLSGWTHYARDLADRADAINAPIRAGRIRTIATTLDAARTNLVGGGDIDAGIAFAVAGRRQILQHRRTIVRIERRRRNLAEAVAS